MTITLRPATVEDIEFFYRLQQDPVAVRMAAFTSANLSDRAVFEERWRQILAEDSVSVFVVLDDTEKGEGSEVGQVLSYVDHGRTEVSYWVERRHWGRGYATEALRLLLDRVRERPLRARVAQDNARSLGVLRHHGFTITGEELSPAEGRGELVREYVLTLDAPAQAGARDA